MPYAPHLRVSAIGSLGSSGAGEGFVFTLSMAAGDALPPLPTAGWQGFTDDVAQDLRAFFKAPATGISGRAQLREVKVAFIGADGKYLRDPYTAPVADGQGGGTDSGSTLPQAALAVSLVTARRGPSGKGRFYVPMPVAPVSFDLLADANLTQGLATSTVGLLQALNNQPGWDLGTTGVCVASTKGFNTPVTGVRVGRVVDTIRTRRRSLHEAYGATVNL